MFAAKEKAGIHVSDECYKMATTDALSVACKQLGIGADVYFEKDKTKYTSANEIPDRLSEVCKELERTGYGKKAILKTYKIDDISQMSDLQIKDFLQKIKTVPDKSNEIHR